MSIWVENRYFPDSRILFIADRVVIVCHLHRVLINLIMNLLHHLVHSYFTGNATQKKDYYWVGHFCPVRGGRVVGYKIQHLY